jgi:hypothetical protein
VPAATLNFAGSNWWILHRDVERRAIVSARQWRERRHTATAVAVLMMNLVAGFPLSSGELN